MAINIFKNVTRNVSVGGEEVYICPVGYSAIVLMAQISNTTALPQSVSVFVSTTDSALTSLVTDYTIPGNDAVGVITGKLVLESGQGILVSGSNDTSMQLVMSILESQN